MIPTLAISYRGKEWPYPTSSMLKCKEHIVANLAFKHMLLQAQFNALHFPCSIACSCPYKFNALCWCSMLDTDTTQQGPTSLKSHHAICKCSNFWKTHSHFANNVLKGAFFFTLWINHFDLVRKWVFQSTCIALHHLFCHLIEHSSPKNWSNTWIVHQSRLIILSIFLFNN